MFRLRMWLLVAVVSLGTGAAFAGCGGGSDSGTGTAASTPSEKGPASVSVAFRDAANEICHVAESRQELILGEARESGEIGKTSDTPKQAKKRADLMETLYRTMIFEFEQLQASGEEKPAKEALLQALEGHSEALEGTGSLDETAADVESLMTSYGVSGCPTA